MKRTTDVKQSEGQSFESPYLTPREAMTYLRLGSRSALQRLIVEHRLPVRRCGTRLRFKRVELDRFLERGA